MAAVINNKIVCGPEEQLIPAHLSFGQFVFDQLKKGSHRIAIICGETGDKITYNDILQQSVNVAAALQALGLRKGDVVTLCSENRFEFFIAALAVIYCGGILSTLNVTYTPVEMKHIFQITKPKFIFTSPITAQNIYECINVIPNLEKIILFGDYDIIPAIMYKDLVKKLVRVDDFTLVDVKGVEDVVAIMCSSGTTGLPKGVMLTHVNSLTSTFHMKYYLETTQSGQNYVVKNSLSLIPWFHVFGFFTAFALMAFQVEIVFLSRFEEQLFLETIQKYKINKTCIVPPLAVFLAKHPLVKKYDLTSLVEVWCGSAPLSSEIHRTVQERTGIKNIRQGYGLTEVTLACCFNMSDGQKLGSCGTPSPGMKIKVIDIATKEKCGIREEGEIWIKSPMCMKGYMGDHAAGEALVDADGYLSTGDVGYYDEDGFFYIVDRIKELIKYKGFQVAPAELEALLLRHEGVADCGVVGLPDEVAGELPLAFVVPQPGVTITAEEIVKYIAAEVSSAKRLRGGVIFVQQIPKNPSGKILRRALKKMLPTNQRSKL